MLPLPEQCCLNRVHRTLCVHRLCLLMICAGWVLILFFVFPTYSAGLFVPPLSPLPSWSLSLQYSYTAPQLEFNAVVFVQRRRHLRVDSAADLHGRKATLLQQRQQVGWKGIKESSAWAFCICSSPITGTKANIQPWFYQFSQRREVEGFLCKTPSAGIFCALGAAFRCL